MGFSPEVSLFHDAVYRTAFVFLSVFRDSFLCIDVGGLLPNALALTTAFGMNIEYFWTGVSFAI